MSWHFMIVTQKAWIQQLLFYISVIYYDLLTFNVLFYLDFIKKDKIFIIWINFYPKSKNFLFVKNLNCVNENTIINKIVYYFLIII